MRWRPEARKFTSMTTAYVVDLDLAGRTALVAAGRIVNISVHGLLALPYKSAYVTAKHGPEGLSKVTALAARVASRIVTCLRTPGDRFAPDRRRHPGPLRTGNR